MRQGDNPTVQKTNMQVSQAKQRQRFIEIGTLLSWTRCEPVQADGMLKHFSFPSLRTIRFDGKAGGVSVAERWPPRTAWKTARCGPLNEGERPHSGDRAGLKPTQPSLIPKILVSTFWEKCPGIPNCEKQTLWCF